MIEADELMKISRGLEKFHGIFYTLWEMGSPLFTDSVDTAAVEFDKKGEQINFLFNKDYWSKLSHYERQFVICHECLHVILNHGVRILDQKHSDSQITNIALDIVVNQLLVNKFGFDKKKIPMSVVWLDTVFPDKEAEDNMHFEYYLNLMKKSSIKLPFSSLDDHSKMSGDQWQDVQEKVRDSLSDEEKEQMQNSLKSAGTEAGDLTLFADTKSFVAKKRKWESVIKKWSNKFLKREFSDTEQWARLNRRLYNLSTDLMLPSDMEIEDDCKDNKKVSVWLFLDTSGSCKHLKDRFFKAARSIPVDKFYVKLFCFDTRVYETSLKTGKLFGFGGTSFSIIEAYIQRHTRLVGKPYPSIIFIASDGYADIVKPQFPDRWHFFLSTNNARCVPSKSKVYKLSEFE